MLPPPVRDGVVEAFARSIHAVFLWAIPFAIAGFLLTWLLKEHPLRESIHVGLEAVQPIAGADTTAP